MDAAINCLGDDAHAFFSDGKERGKYYVDMQGANSYLLARAGVPRENVEVMGLCTYEHPEYFWSHRYTRGNRGTMLSVITL